jgi:hypothetical protein
MATKMPADWQPPAKRRHLRVVTPKAARWAAYADGGWWALTLGADLPAGTTLAGHYRAAWTWADYRGWTCSGYRDEKAGVLHLRIVPTADEAAA